MKWKKRLEEIVPKLYSSNKKGEEMLKNIRAYISDSMYFLEEGDYVRSFEAIIWAWAIYEICRDLNVLEFRSE